MSDMNSDISIETVPAKSILSSWGESGWFGSNYTMNLYRGCCHGCIYCDSRSECYNIDNFDNVRVKADAIKILERELKSKRKKGVIITGSMSDSYNPFEKELEITRKSLELMLRYGYGVVIDTKSSLVTRDIDILKKLSKSTSACVNMTVTTFDDALCKSIEQRVCPSSERFMALRKLADEGIDCGILLMPILPFINDNEENIVSIVNAAYDAGVKWVYAANEMFVTMRARQREHFMSHVGREMSARYAETYGNSYMCVSPNNDKLYPLFTKMCEERGIMHEMKDIEAYMGAKFLANHGAQLSMF